MAYGNLRVYGEQALIGIIEMQGSFPLVCVSFGNSHKLSGVSVK